MSRRPQTVEKAQRKLGFFYKIIISKPTVFDKICNWYFYTYIKQNNRNPAAINEFDITQCFGFEEYTLPEDLKEILEYYLIKPTGTADCNNEQYIQLSLVDDADVVNVD